MYRVTLALIVLANCCWCSYSGQVREYYLAAVDIEWDYAPSGKNVITGRDIQENSIEAKYLIGGSDRIGAKYGKALFFGYTDASFTEQIPKSDWQGLLGPIIYGEIGDTIRVTFKNMASRPYSLHTHGMLYTKISEGAKYEDGTPARERVDDSVPAGSNHTYIWTVDEISGPSEGDDNCIAWPYHTHIETPHGTNTGMVGSSVICRPGILDVNGKRTDVDEDFVLLVTVIDENMSYYIDENIQKYCTDPDTSDSVDPEDEDFVESNMMHSINGYVYGNLPGLEMCLGDRVAWHVFSLGTETDMHTLYFHGNVLNIRGHRRDAFSTSPAYFLSGEMETTNPGTWLMTSEVNNHFLAGTQMLYTVDENCGGNVDAAEFQAKSTREYFFKIEEMFWNYGPLGVDAFDGTPFNDSNSPAYPFFVDNSERIGGVYKKAQYVAYTNATFTTKIDRPLDEQHLGFLGPVIRAEVGDEISVTLMNGAGRNYSILPHGVMYDKANEGSGYDDGTDGSDKADDAVAPGETYTYHWTIPDNYGPTERDQDCLTWLYYSAVDQERDVYSGLVGPILVCRPGTLNEDGKRTDVVEFNLLLMTVDENRSWYIEENIEMYTNLNATEALEDEEFIESNTMEAINGYSFANLPGLNEVCRDRDVSWHLSALGGDTDQHTVYLRGNTVIWDDRRTDTVSLTPGNSVTVHMAARNKGVWGIECMTGSHFTHGMKALYTVHSGCTSPTQVKPNVEGTTRTYYIGAQEMNWDYAPIKVDLVRNESLLNEDSFGHIFVRQDGPFIGSTYKKALFVQFTDDTFTTEIPVDENDRHFGILGPMITAEVGDQIKVIFKNSASREYTMHPHGLMYNKSNNDAILDTPVQPGDTYIYTWGVPADSGPSEGDRDCVLYVYYSDVDRARDTHSGLIGPLVVCRPGILGGTNGRRVDVDREFVLLFSVFDENKSWYLDDNIRDFSPEPDLVDKEDADFDESNLMHGINGLLYGNSKHLDAYLGETVEWYLIGVGEEVDIHTVHFHGQPVIYQQWTKHRVDVVELFPGIFSTVQMKIKEVGQWLLHCHVNDHMLAGMETTYTVTESRIPDITTQDSGEPIFTTPSTASSLVSYSTALLFTANFVIVLVSCTL